MDLERGGDRVCARKICVALTQTEILATTKTPRVERDEGRRGVPGRRG